MSRLVEELGYNIDHAFTLNDGLDKIYSMNFDIILLDVNLPDGNGLEVIDDIIKMPVHPQIIIMTAFSDPDGAELAIESGAWDYIEKPASSKRLKLQISRALQFQEQKKISKAPVLLKSNNIIGNSKAIKLCLEQVAQIANSEANVLITGETGTGKELFARIIHENSSRQNNNFIVVDCSILTENFIESVLFGHEKGSFTGADNKRNGLVTLANNGTLFLDEIGELPKSIQVSFLRVLQEKKFRAVGGEQEIYSNFRVIAATNKDLDHMVYENRFRSDLLYRLKTLNIELPALRKRKEDIKDIAIFHNNQLCEQYEIAPKELSSDFLETLVKYDWPGNVRELVNTIESCILVAESENFLFAYHIPKKIRAKVTRSSITKSNIKPGNKNESHHPSNDLLKYKDVIEKTEKEYLASLYSHTNGDIKFMGQISGISRAVLYRKLKKHKLQ
ncbi:MAG: sigma-54 dependent transcriptional regulator [Desulfobacula sp.]|nr:sigma-54 dependent transcriptional regulator [Desulfobacula sp.]